jgi:high-affinity iron transporter
MFATALIVFRETLEAALFIGIVAAATRELAGRARWLSAGVAAGVLGAVLLAWLAGRISGWFDGLGQDVMTIAILSVALLMLLWHCLWGSAHAREMAGEAKRVGAAVQDGRQAPWALAVTVGLAVLREGAETVLFVSGALTGTSASPAAVLSAGAMGLTLGVAAGAMLYAGLSRIPARHVFAVTQLLIALLAASLASQLARALAQAGLLELGSSPMWDSSGWLSPDSATGTLMHALVGYDAQPSAAQLTAYVLVLFVILAATRAAAGKRSAA